MGTILNTNHSNIQDAVDIYYGFILKSRDYGHYSSSLNDAEKIMYSNVITNITRELTPVELVQLHAELVARKIVFKEIFEEDSMFKSLSKKIIETLEYRIEKLSVGEKNEAIAEINEIMEYEQNEIETTKQWISKKREQLQMINSIVNQKDLTWDIESSQNHIDILQNHIIIYEEHLARFKPTLKK